MKTVNELKYVTTEIYLDKTDGGTYMVKAKVSLNDECDNGIYNLHVTGEVKLKDKDGIWRDHAVGCCHDYIEKCFPELKMFINIHGCNHYGQPLYPVANGMFHFKENGLEKGMEYLRITEEAEGYALASCLEDELYFKYQLYHLGIVDRWRREADEAIAILEKLCGENWENPYDPDHEKFVLRMTDDERELMEERIKTGYYSLESIKKRKEGKLILKHEKDRERIQKEYEKAIRKAEEERAVYLEVIRCGISLENVHYSHGELLINWINSFPKITDKEYAEFMRKIDYSNLPDGIIITLKNRREL